MAHELEIVDGQAQMFSVKETPWHRLGHIIETAPSIEEGIRLAGLNWQVTTEPVYTLDAAGVPVQAPAKATRRADTGALLGVVGPSYEPLQNSEAFKFFQPFIDNKLATLETAGSLRDGKRVWVMAKLGLDDSIIVPASGDRVAKYVLLSNSHDGTLAIRVGFTPVRVVCNNTLQMSIQDKASRLIRIRHTGKVAENLEKIRDVMNLANQQFEATAEQYRFLAGKQISQSDLEKYVKIVFSTPKQLEDPESQGGSKVLPNIVRLFEGGRGNDMEGVKGTLWAAYNAVTEYVQYERGEDAGVRLDNTWFGQGATINKKALDTALVLAAA